MRWIYSEHLSKSRLNRRLHEIDISIWQSIFHALCEIFRKNNKCLEYKEKN